MAGALNAAAESWFRYMASAATQATLLLVIVLVAVRVARRWSPALKHGLLVLALFKFAVPPTFNLPTGLFSQLRPARYAATALPAQGVPPMVERGLWPEEPAAESRASEPDSAGVKQPGPVTEPRPDAPHPLSMKTTLMLAQLAGALVILLVIVRQQLRLRRIASSAVAAPDGLLLNEYSSLCHRLGLRRRPALLVTESYDAPIAFGVWNPIVLLPQKLVSALALSELRPILAHELAHHRRRDLWFHWLQAPIAAIWWFHPGYWLLSRRLRSVREDCCDDLVVSCGVASGDTYCEALLQAARVTSGSAVPGASLAFIETGPLQRRFRRLLSAGFSPGPKLALGGILLVACLGLLLLPGIKPRSVQKTSDCRCAPCGEIREALAALPDIHDMRLPREERVGPLRALAQRYPRDLFVQMRLQDSFIGLPGLYPEVESAFALYRSDPSDPVFRYLDARLTGSFDVARAAKMLDDLATDEPAFVWAHLESPRLTDTFGFRDPETAQRHLRIFLDACPESLEGYRMLRTVDDPGMIREGATKFRELLEAKVDSESLPYWRDLWDLEFRAARKGDEDQVIRRITADVAAMRNVPLQPKDLWYATFQRALQLTGNGTILTWMHEKAKTSPPEGSRNAPGVDTSLTSLMKLNSGDADDSPLADRLAAVDRCIEFHRKWPDAMGEEDPPFPINVARLYVRWRARLDEVPDLAQQALRQAEKNATYSLPYGRDRSFSYDQVAETRREGDALVAEAYRLQGNRKAWEDMRRRISEAVAATPKPASGRELKYEEPLPDFQATDMQGRTWRLNDLKGKATLVSIWSAEGPLEAHVDLEALYERNRGRNDFQILTFSWDLNPYLAERHMKANGYKFPVIISRTLVERLFRDWMPGQQWRIIDARGRPSSRMPLRRPWLNWPIVSELTKAAAVR